jgi:hypothetical protein
MVCQCLTSDSHLLDRCASHLNVLCESALNTYEKYSTYNKADDSKNKVKQRGVLVNYDSIPGIIPKIVLPLFKVDLTDKWLTKMIDESSQYSKSRVQKSAGEFLGDSEDKDERATEGIVTWAEKILQPSYELMDQAAKEGLQNLIQNHPSLQQMNQEGRSLLDWTQWKEMPALEEMDSSSQKQPAEEEEEQEEVSLDSIPIKKFVPLVRNDLKLESNAIQELTGDATNTIDPVTGRIEVGIHAQGVKSIRYEVMLAALTL